METALLEEVDEARTLSNALNNSDRCDACGAQAFVWVNMPNSKSGLLYCSHHFNKYETKLREVAIDIYDERYKINVKASSSSPD
jgi:hypothetical protein